MVFVAACVGAPLAYYLMSKWLTNFEFRTTISLSIVLISIIGTAVVAFLMLIFRLIKPRGLIRLKH
jgi:phosphate/sulfate permease